MLWAPCICRKDGVEWAMVGSSENCPLAAARCVARLG